MMRYDAIMAALENGMPYEQVADMYHTEVETVECYDLVRQGKDYRMGQREFERYTRGADIPEETLERVREMLEKGMTQHEISAALGHTRHWVEKVKNYLASQGYRTPKERKLARADAKKDTIIKEYYNGKSWGQIGEIVDMTADEVRCVLYRYVYNGRGVTRRREKHG